MYGRPFSSLNKFYNDNINDQSLRPRKFFFSVTVTETHITNDLFFSLIYDPQYNRNCKCISKFYYYYKLLERDSYLLECHLFTYEYTTTD